MCQQSDWLSTHDSLNTRIARSPESTVFEALRKGTKLGMEIEMEMEWKRNGSGNGNEMTLEMKWK